MHSWEEPERANVLRTQALALMDSKGIPSTPVNFELWFFYVLGHDLDLCRALDAAMANGNARDPVRAKEIHTRFFVRSDERIDSARETISKELVQLNSALTSAGEEAVAYGATLDETREMLGQSSTPAAVSHVVQNAATATAEMEARNRALEEQVEASKRELHALKIRLEAIRQESRVDALTGIANRRAFDEYIESAIKDSEQDRQPLCVLMCDIDHFKQFNDTWGHATGDQVLKLVAAQIKANIKGRDFAARYGGEEMVVALPRTQLSDGIKVAEHIRTVIESKKVVKKSTGEPLGQVTVSIGIAQRLSGDMSDELLKRADAHLYAAKLSGRNRVSWIKRPQPPCTEAPERAGGGQALKSRIVNACVPTLELEFVDQDSSLIIDAQVDVVDERLVTLLAWWRSLCQPGELPRWKSEYLDELGYARDCVHLHKVEPGADELQVQYVGAALIRVLGADPTGFRYSATNVPISGMSSTAARVFEVAKLTSSMKEPLRSFSKGVRHLANGNFNFEILFVPFGDSGGRVEMLLGATIYTPILESESIFAA